MKQETINQFHDYLKDQGHVNTTIAGYIRTICDLEEPPDTTDPLILLVYVDRAIKLKAALPVPLPHSILLILFGF